MLSIKEIQWAQILKQNHYHPSSRDWSDEVIYFLLADRFSDAKEDGYKDHAGNTVPGARADAGNAVATPADITAWESADAHGSAAPSKGSPPSSVT